ncbi:MAG: phosphatidate cytidylyltransferase [Planctomycetaceae bacterium]
MTTPSPGLLYAVAGTVAALIVGSVVRLLLIRNASAEVASARRQSLATWWILVTLLCLAVLSGLPGTAVLMAMASGLGLREYLRLAGGSELNRVTKACAFGLVPLHYGSIAVGYSGIVRVFLPMAAVVLTSVFQVASGPVRGYIRSTTMAVWGILLLVYLPSFALFLFELPLPTLPQAGVAGWFLFLMILTEMDDIAQAIVGRRFGRHKMVPAISPNKSWEGFFGGLACTTGLAIVLAPWLTTFQNGRSPVGGIVMSAVAGAVIMVSGFFGDINMSAVKRDAGVKDGSRLLPGHGGMIDRIDSLTFTAPVFYGFVLAVCV